MTAGSRRNLGVPDADYHQNRFAAVLSDLVRPGCRWLDLGAGARVHGGWSGVDQRDLAGRAGMFVGSELHAEHLRQNPYLMHRCLANGDALPFCEGAFDLVSANMVVEHLEHPEQVFGEIARVLSPGGRAVFVTPNRMHPAVWVSAVALTRSSRRNLAHRVERRDLEHVFPTYYRCNTPSAVRRVAARVGLAVDDIQIFSSFPIFRDGPMPARMMEKAFLRLVRVDALRHFRSNIIAVFRKAG